MGFPVFERLSPKTPDLHVIDENRSIGFGDPAGLPSRIAHRRGVEAVAGIDLADKPKTAIGEAFGEMKAGGRQVGIALVSDRLLEELIDRFEEHILLQYLGF